MTEIGTQIFAEDKDKSRRERIRASKKPIGEATTGKDIA